MAVDEQEVSSNHGVQGLLLSDTEYINYRVAGVDPELSMGGKGRGYLYVIPTFENHSFFLDKHFLGKGRGGIEESTPAC